MAARICPHCRTRVDERRAGMSPYCLSCGAPLGSAPPTTGFGKAPAKSSPLPWILGAVGLVLLLGIGGVILLVAVANAEPDKPQKTEEVADPDSGPLLEVPTAVPSLVIDGGPPGKPVKPVATGLKIGSPPPPTAPVVVGAFPRARANNELDRVSAGLGSCHRAGDPSGSSSIRVDFEPDGRVGTLLGRPFSGTATGACITARYQAIKVGAFTGTVQSITHSFNVASSSNPGF